MSAEMRRLNAEIDAWLCAPENEPLEYVTLDQVLTQAISSDRGRTRRAMEMLIAKLMRERGWIHQRRMVNGKRTWGFLKP